MPGALWIWYLNPARIMTRELMQVLLVEAADRVTSDPYYFTDFVEHLGLFTFQLLT